MTHEGLVVRPAHEAELGRIVELLVLGSVPGGPPSTEDPDELGPYRAAWRDIVERDGVVLVAELAGAVVGVCQLIVFRHLQAHGGLCAEIESVHVHPITVAPEWAARSWATPSPGPVLWAVTGCS